MACHFTAIAPLTTTGAGSAGGSTFVVVFGEVEADGDGVAEGEGVTDGDAVTGADSAGVAEGVGEADGDGDSDSVGTGASEAVPVGVGAGVTVAAPVASADWDDGVAVAESSARAGEAARDPAAKLRSRAAVSIGFLMKHPLPRQPVRTGLLSQWFSRSSRLTPQPISLPGQFL
jgi:hypothetical protein